jgi:hypothetical protein
MLTASCERRHFFLVLAAHSSRLPARPQLGKRRSHVLGEHGWDDWRATEISHVSDWTDGSCRRDVIDFANGGNIKGMIAAADIYLKMTNAKTRIVPGHGPIADKAALQAYRTMMVTVRDRMAKLVKDGKSEDDVVAAKPFADLDAKSAPTELASRNFIRVVYHSLADKPDAAKKAAAEAHPATEMNR